MTRLVAGPRRRSGPRGSFHQDLGGFVAEAVVGPIPVRWLRGESDELAERTVGAGFGGAGASTLKVFYLTPGWVAVTVLPA
jgi:hypothetical protein